jgi:hypothetical protein
MHEPCVRLALAPTVWPAAVKVGCICEDCMRSSCELALLFRRRGGRPERSVSSQHSGMRCESAPRARRGELARSWHRALRIAVAQTVARTRSMVRARARTCARSFIEAVRAQRSQHRCAPQTYTRSRRAAFDAQKQTFLARTARDRMNFRGFCKRTLVATRGLCHVLQQGQCSTVISRSD